MINRMFGEGILEPEVRQQRRFHWSERTAMTPASRARGGGVERTDRRCSGAQWGCDHPADPEPIEARRPVLAPGLLGGRGLLDSSGESGVEAVDLGAAVALDH